jgi:hypothetical protein
VAVELSKGPIVCALQKFNCFVIYLINPSTLAKYRETFTPSGAKDDPTDAEFAVDLLLRHPDHFKPIQPQSVEMRTLASLVEQRRSLVNDKIRITNRLRAALKHYYPQALDWFEHIDTPLFCDFIEHWPTLTQVKRARKSTFAARQESRSSRPRELPPQALTEAYVRLSPHTALHVPCKLPSLRKSLVPPISG